MKVCVLATGPSMSQGLADSLRHENCIAVNNAYQLAPWAIGLCANDSAWWRAHPDAKEFAGRKFSTNRIEGVERIDKDPLASPQSSSGCLAVLIAQRIFDAKVIELHGFDNRGSHYFGPHPEPLRNTSETRFSEFQNQLDAIGRHLSKLGVRVVNKTPGSALRCFPFE